MARSLHFKVFAVAFLTLWQTITVSAASTGQQLLDKYISGATLNDNQLSILAGYHTVYSWPGGTLPRRLLNLAAAGKVGGVIIFGENVNDDLPSQILSLQDAYARGPAYDGTPLLITTDQEGGVVARLPGGPEESAKDIGSSAQPAKAAASAGAVAAAACKAYNVNGNLAPVLDVYREEGDFDDQYERSYSMDPLVARKCGAAFIKSQQANGVLATAKHFPGLGAASADENTDLGPVTLNVPLREIRTIDEVPFQGAIAREISMIMPSWAIYPALDPDRPAGLSEKWIKSELRGRLGFKGVTISDALEAGALEAYGSNASRGVSAVKAGMDIALASARDVSQGYSVLNAIVAAMKNGGIDRDDFAQSTKRVLALRQRL